VNGLQGQINDVRKQALSGVAIVSAMAAAAPVIEAGKDNAMSVAGGTYRGYGAVAMSYARRTSYGRVTASVGYTATNLAASVATGWSW
jgi:autotransporter adhesin